MYFSMGHMMWGWPLPRFYDDNHVAMGLTQLLLTVIIMVINQKFFISGFKSLWHRAPNMDTLVALGATAAFVYSSDPLAKAPVAGASLGTLLLPGVCGISLDFDTQGLRFLRRFDSPAFLCRSAKVLSERTSGLSGRSGEMRAGMAQRIREGPS